MRPRIRAAFGIVSSRPSSFGYLAALTFAGCAPLFPAKTNMSVTQEPCKGESIMLEVRNTTGRSADILLNGATIGTAPAKSTTHIPIATADYRNGRLGSRLSERTELGSESLERSERTEGVSIGIRCL